MSSIKHNPEPTLHINKTNASIINKNNTEFLIKNCNENINIDTNNRSELDNIFFQDSIYKYPKLIICGDKLAQQNADVYKNYSDVIYDDCGVRFNIRNLKDAAGVLQENYAKNIDLDSHLKNINYYNDKCYYDNWKVAPNNNALDKCNGLKSNSKLLLPDYTIIGRDYTDCIGVCDKKSACTSTPPTDLNCENNIRKRYDFTKHKFQKESCIKPADWTSFKHAPTPNINNSSYFPDEKRALELINTINKDVQHDYYQFFDNNKCMTFPQQRLFNNVTKRSMLPTHHNLEDMGPKYLV